LRKKEGSYEKENEKSPKEFLKLQKTHPMAMAIPMALDLSLVALKVIS
jgi:hypothetical protein